MKQHIVACAILAFAQSGCDRDPRLDPVNRGPALSRHVEAPTRSVDGLVVGHRLMDAGEYELALREYYRAASVHGLNADVLSAIGSANLRLGRLGQAERTLRRAVDEDEKFAAAWNNLGAVLMEQGKVGEAERVFRIAFSLDGGRSADIRENLENAIAQLENPANTTEQQSDFELVHANGENYRLQAHREAE